MTVLFDESIPGARFFGVTWAYDGITWVRIPISGQLPVRSGHGLSYDPVQDRLILYDDRDYSFGLHVGAYDDTWSRHGGAGSAPLPPASRPPVLDSAEF